MVCVKPQPRRSFGREFQTMNRFSQPTTSRYSRSSNSDLSSLAASNPSRKYARSFAGHVTEIAPIAQEDSNQSMRRSFRVVILLDESDPERMRPGMSVKAEILPPPRDDSLVVPRIALDLSNEPYHAMLADGSTAEVRLGPCNSMACVIEEGLDEGARLRHRR